uniref:Ig-like domain-containing protein n=1 Tax=Aquila chrysaetos chrysaetos TaxID=223781 RepID=A0A663F3C8_AQUCH
VATFPPGTQRAVLRLQALREEDAGRYVCEALGEAGVAFDGTVLDVGSAPHFPEPLGDTAVEVGGSVSLLCRVEGSPPPRVTWSRQDGKPVTGWHGPRGVSSKLEAAELFIDSASLDDQAIYICEAQNEFGKIQAEVKLTVTGHAAPEIALASPVVRALSGQPVSLSCVILAGRPFPARRWLKDGQPVRLPRPLGWWVAAGERCQGSIWVGRVTWVYHHARMFLLLKDQFLNMPQRHGDTSLLSSFLPSLPFPLQGTEPISLSPRYHLDPDGTLLIPLPSPGDAGTYFCTATNVAGFSSRETQLSVSTKPRISVNGSQASDPVTILAVLGQETTLPCEVQGYPPPLVVWTQDSSVPSPLRYSVLPSGSLRLVEPQVTDTGLYTCTATNAAGNASLSYSLHVQGSCPQVKMLLPWAVGLNASVLLLAPGIPLFLAVWALPAPFQVTRGQSSLPAPYCSLLRWAEMGARGWWDRLGTRCPPPSSQVAEGRAPAGRTGWCGGVRGRWDPADHSRGAQPRRGLYLPGQQPGRGGPGGGAGFGAR